MTGPTTACDRDEIVFRDGFHEQEYEEGVPFRWMSDHGRLEWRPSSQARFFEIEVCSEVRDLSQALAIEIDGRPSRFALVHGWSTLPAEIPEGARSAELSVSHVLPADHHPRDSRVLAVRIRRPLLHDDGERYRAVSVAFANTERNQREILSGADRLASTPVNLGVDIHGACNIKPPCVYCEWDSNKRLEGANAERSFTIETLKGYGRFFDQAAQIFNCSIGEPFMKRDLPEIFELINDRGALLELSTNGQILTEEQLHALIGRRIHLYVSIDAASAETYARLRNRRFGSVMTNVRKLVRAKGGRGRFPLVDLIFMPMRANLHELDAFVRLCAELEVDRLVLRPLNAVPELDLDCERAGYVYRYHDELLPLKERIRLSGYAHELCRRNGVALANQLDFGGATAEMFTEWWEEGRQRALAPPEKEAGQGTQTADIREEPQETTAGGSPPAIESRPLPPAVSGSAFDGSGWPLCIEPWRTLCVLRRGILPCSYGGRPVAAMDDLEGAWNGDAIRSIRAALARGRFHRYCLRTPSCPVVQKYRKAVVLPMSQRALALLYDVWFILNRTTGGAPRATWRALKAFLACIPGRPRSRTKR
jgi:MoaA/NifB/PqqE/SkfB family radical SAM enzyme